MVATGTGLAAIDTRVEAVAVQVPAEVTVTEYVVAVAGVTVMAWVVAPVLQI